MNFQNKAFKNILQCIYVHLLNNSDCEYANKCPYV